MPPKRGNAKKSHKKGPHPKKKSANPVEDVNQLGEQYDDVYKNLNYASTRDLMMEAMSLVRVESARAQDILKAQREADATEVRMSKSLLRIMANKNMHISVMARHRLLHSWQMLHDKHAPILEHIVGTWTASAVSRMGGEFIPWLETDDEEAQLPTLVFSVGDNEIVFYMDELKIETGRINEPVFHGEAIRHHEATNHLEFIQYENGSPVTMKKMWMRNGRLWVRFRRGMENHTILVQEVVYERAPPI